MSRSKYSTSEKFDILMEYYNGDLSKSDILKKYSIHKKSLEDWEYKVNHRDRFIDL